MHARLSDAELVLRCQVREQHGVNAFHKLGISASMMRESLREAKLRGLTAKTKVMDVEEKLRTKNKMLEAELASVRRDNITAEEVRKTLFGLAANTPDPPRWIVAKRKAGNSGVPMSIWSDWHYGEKVSREEVGGVNTFNRKVAKDRVRKLVEATLDLCFNHMVKPKYPGFVLCLGGDMISGDIHEELRETNDGSVQQSVLEVEELLIWGIEQLADRFGKIFVPCVVGNHARTTRKPRAKRRVYESHEWGIYCRLERYFKADKRVQFSIPGESDAYFSVAGHRFLLTHGDTLGVKGGDGIIGALGPITRGAIKVGRNQAQIGRDFDTLLIGHWHTYVPRGDASSVICNGALKGFDEYAHTFLRVPYSRPSQALWFVHPNVGITAQWAIYLEEKKQSMRVAPWLKWQESIAA